MKKKYFYRTERELEGLKWTSKVIDLGLSLTVISALNELTTAYVILCDHKDVFHHKVKLCANKAVKRAYARRSMIFFLMKSKKFFDVYTDKVIDLAEQDVTLFRIAIKQTLDDNKFPDSELISYIETARTLLDNCVAQFKSIQEEAFKKFGYKYEKAFEEFNMSDVLYLWDKVCKLLYASKTDIDLNTERCIRLYKKMADKFAQGDYVSECLKEAYEVEPDFSNQIIVKD